MTNKHNKVFLIVFCCLSFATYYLAFRQTVTLTSFAVINSAVNFNSFQSFLFQASQVLYDSIMEVLIFHLIVVSIGLKFEKIYQSLYVLILFGFGSLLIIFPILTSINYVMN